MISHFNSLVSGIVRVGQQLRQNARGNVLILLGFSMVPLTLATGMSIDYARAARLQTKLNATADAAALAASTTPMLNKTMAQACTAATNMFNTQSSNLAGLTINTANPAQLTIIIKETYSGATTPVTATCGSLTASQLASVLTPASRTTTVTYNALSANAFSGVVGFSSINIGGTSTAQVGRATYFQIVFLVDVSNSMGIGGTTTDINNLNNDPTIRCSFACHDPNGTIGVAASNWCNANPTDYFCHLNQNYCPFGAGACATVNPSPTYSDRRGLAKIYGYKLKIDYVNDAVTSFINSLQSNMQSSPNNYSVSIYTFGTGFTQLQAPTTNWTALNANSGKIDLEVAARSPAGYANQGWTYTSTGMQTLSSSLTNVGDGSSPTARKTFVIFLSDGVEDTFSASAGLIYNRITTYNYAQQCQMMKNNGITMFSVETAYPAIINDPDGQYNVLVAQLPSRNNGTQISDIMKGCASSPDRYFLASDGPGIQAAVNSVFNAISAQASHLTQ